jgi:hypothetical protein
MKKNNFSVLRILVGILYLALAFMVTGCASTGGTVETAQQTPPASAPEAAKPKVNAEELIGQYSGAKDEGAEAITSKERFEAIIRQLADSTIVWDDAQAGTGQLDDGTAMQEVRFALRLNESKPAVLDILDSKDGWGWQYEGMLRDKEPGAVNVRVRRILLNDGNPAVEIVLVARDKNKKVTCKGITRSRFYGNEGKPGVLPNTASVNEAVAFLEELLT